MYIYIHYMWYVADADIRTHPSAHPHSLWVCRPLAIGIAGVLVVCPPSLPHGTVRDAQVEMNCSSGLVPELPCWVFPPHRPSVDSVITTTAASDESALRVSQSATLQCAHAGYVHTPCGVCRYSPTICRTASCC